MYSNQLLESFTDSCSFDTEKYSSPEVGVEQDHIPHEVLKIGAELLKIDNGRVGSQ